MLVKSITTCFHYFCCVIDQTTEAFVAQKESIAEKGGLELILVTQNGGEYRLVAGERRLLACRTLNGETIPARILTNAFEEYDVTALQLIENMLREDLNPLAQAKGILGYFQARHPLELDAAINHLITFARDKSRLTDDVAATVGAMTKITGKSIISRGNCKTICHSRKRSLMFIMSLSGKRSLMFIIWFFKQLEPDYEH